MDPFGHFGWNFGFGFGWILIGVFVLLMVIAIAQLVRFGSQGKRTKAGEQAAFDSLKQEICENKITVEEFDEKMHTKA